MDNRRAVKIARAARVQLQLDTRHIGLDAAQRAREESHVAARIQLGALGRRQFVQMQIDLLERAVLLDQLARRSSLRCP